MPGKYQYDIELKSNVAKLLTDMKEVQDRLDTVEGKEYKIKLNVDEKKLSNVISNLEKMLDSLGKGTGDFKQFENLSKELSSIVSEVQNLSKAFGKVDDSGTKTLLSSIQNIDKSLSELSQHIINVNKNMSNIGGDTNGTVKQVENISNAYDNASKSAEKLAEAQSKIGNKSNISSANETPKSIENTTNAITEQTNALKELILSWVEAQKVMSKSGSASTEKIAVGNLSNGFVSNSNFTGDLNSISDKLIRNIIENATETVDTIIHSHPDYNLAAFSPEDIASSIIRFATGIQNQIIVGMDEISIMDVSKIKDINPLEIKNKIEQELSSLINSYIKNQLQSIDSLQRIFVNNFSGGLDEWSTFTDLISENTNSDFLKNVIQKYKDSISDALINMGSDYKFSNSDELGTFIYENVIKKYVRSYVSNSNPDINQSEYDALQKEALENFKKEFSAIYDKAFSIKDYESLLTDNEIQPIVKEAFSNILKTFGLKYEDVIKTISVEQLRTSSISPMKDVFQGDKIEQATTSAKELDKTLEQVDIPTDSFDDVLSKLDLTESKLKEIVKITKQSVSDSEGKFHDSYTLKDKRGSTEIYGLSSNTEKGQLLRSNIVGYDAKAEAQESKRLVEENIRLNKAYYDSKKQEEVEYQRLRAKYLVEGKAQEKKYYADLQKSADNTKLEEQKRIYKELNDSLDRYATVSKRIASGNALGSDEEEASKLQERIEELQNSPILSKEQLELSQSKLEKIETILEDIQKITKETTLDSLQSEIDSFNKDYDNRNIKPTDENRSIEYQRALDKYLASIKELSTEKERLSKLDSISEEELSHYKELKGVVQENAKALKAMSSAQKGSDALSRGKEIDTITKYLNKFTGISKQAKQELKGLLDQLQSGDPSVNVKKIHERFLELTVAERNAGREARNLFDIFKDKKIYSFLGQAASMFSFYDLISLGRESFQTIREIDTALVDLKKTTAMNSSQLEEFYFDSNDVAKQMGVTTQAIIEQASAWSRLGYNTKEQSTQMAELSSQFAAISPDMDLDTATDGLVSSMKAFDIEVSNVERDIMDNINRIGNTAATSNGEIVDMLTRSSAAMAAANNTIQETIALETAAVEITRNAETTGTAFKTLSMRIRGRQTLPPYTVMYMLCA